MEESRCTGFKLDIQATTGGQRKGGMREGLRELPVNLSETRNELVLHALMPGAEPEDIAITLSESSISIRSKPRGKLQEGAKRRMQAWKIGNYERTVSLPKAVESQRVNVTYKNDVRTVTLPLGVRITPREIRLTKGKSAQGEEVGPRGRVSTNVPV